MTARRVGVVRVGCVLCAVAALLLAIVAGNDLYFTGFPDSHLTDYDIAAETPKRVLMWVEWAFVAVFLLLAFAPVSAGVRTVGLLAGIVAVIAVAAVQWVGIPWYFITHLGLDNGIGG